MAIHNVTILVDCETIVRSNPPATAENRVIQMFADPSIVLDNSQGSYELSIQVNNQDVIRWFPAPLFAYPTGADAGSAQVYSVIITADYDWNQNCPFLKNWTAWQGSTDIWTYQSDGIALSSNADATVKAFGDFQPYAQAQASAPRLDPGKSQREAYTFYIDIYQGSNRLVHRYTWDPYVTVYQP